jgi:predicted DNA-binding ribbon-helix-helix protein
LPSRTWIKSKSRVTIYRTWTLLVKSVVISRAISVAGRKTSVSVEDAFWLALRQIANQRKLTLSKLVTFIDAERQNANLSSAIRLYVLKHFQDELLIAKRTLDPK